MLSRIAVCGLLLLAIDNVALAHAIYIFFTLAFLCAHAVLPVIMLAPSWTCNSALLVDVLDDDRVDTQCYTCCMATGDLGSIREALRVTHLSGCGLAQRIVQSSRSMNR